MFFWKDKWKRLGITVYVIKYSWHGDTFNLTTIYSHHLEMNNDNGDNNSLHLQLLQLL